VRAISKSRGVAGVTLKLSNLGVRYPFAVGQNFMRSPFLSIFQLSHRAAVTADMLAIVAFVTVGLINHKGGLSASGYARDVLPIGGCWLVAAGPFDLYKHPRWRALLATWLVGVTAGVLVRALVRWRLDGDDAVFLPVALCFSLLFVLAFRFAARLLVLRT
jgi:hypothetical protein